MSEEATIKGFSIINLDDMLAELGEDRVKSILSDFSCPINKDVEEFLHKKAIEFSLKALSKTHLVFCSFKKSVTLIAYFTIATKFINLGKHSLSTSLRKRVSKFGTYDKELKKHIIAAPLIAQLGKNYKYFDNNLITGDEILKMACEKISEMQSIGGGKICYLECESTPKLIEFYTSNGFVSFGCRTLDKDEINASSCRKLEQMLKYL